MLKVQVIGNLGGDATVNSGNFKTFISFNVAHTEKYVDRQGISQENVFWVNCIINWNAEKILPYLKKGAKVFCSGQLRTRTYQSRTKGGETVAGIDCIVSDIELCGGARPEQAPTQANQLQNPQNPFSNDSNNDNAPF